MCLLVVLGRGVLDFQGDGIGEVQLWIFTVTASSDTARPESTSMSHHYVVNEGLWTAVLRSVYKRYDDVTMGSCTGQRASVRPCVDLFSPLLSVLQDGGLGTSLGYGAVSVTGLGGLYYWQPYCSAMATVHITTSGRNHQMEGSPPCDGMPMPTCPFSFSTSPLSFSTSPISFSTSPFS